MRAYLGLVGVTCVFVVMACGASDPETITEQNQPAPAPTQEDPPVANVPDASSIEVPSVPATEVCEAFATSLCAFFAKCSPEYLTGSWESAAQCEPRLRENCVVGHPPDAKLRKDDADAYLACLNGLTCDSVYGPEWNYKCETPRLAATKPLDAPCRKDFECESNACTGSSTRCGKCVEKVPAGMPCTQDSVCERHGVCTFQTERCTVPAFLGESCDTFHVCGNGLECSGGKCVVVDGGVGAPCTSDADCDFPHFIQCNRATNQCELTTWLEPGDTCPAASADGPPAECTKGSSCIRPMSSSPGTCTLDAKVGEACGPDKRCEAFINCRNNVCVLPTFEACP